MLTVAEHMELRCLCGKPRREHAHSYADTLLPGDVLNPHPVDLHVIGVQNDCKAFTGMGNGARARRQPLRKQAPPSTHDGGRLKSDESTTIAGKEHPPK